MHSGTSGCAEICPADADAPLIVHLVYRLDFGGLENGLVNLVNHLPVDRFRHTVICITDSTEFRQRITRPGVDVYALHKREGNDLSIFPRLWRLLRKLKPRIVHTRNLATLEGQLPALLAGVPVRLHGEHGWDQFDPQGLVRKYQWIRRVFRLVVKHYIPLSGELERYLTRRIHVPVKKITRIYNGVDIHRFRPDCGNRSLLKNGLWAGEETLVIGTVGRMHGVKDQITLVEAFIALREMTGEAGDRLRLVLIGDGPLRAQAQSLLRAANAEDAAWLPGSRDDIPEILRNLDVFVLPSRAEGISNTLLEAMATGLPVVATRVGGNPELVVDGETGRLVPPADPRAMAQAMAEYLHQPELPRIHGKAGRERVKKHFSLAAMVDNYLRVYEEMLAGVSR